MSAALSSFCIACARFTAGDKLGELLAVIAAAPFFALYHAAVLLHARRELHVAFVLLGMLITAALSSSLKKVLQQPRPAATCALLGNCHKHGMPSSHSAVMAYAATTCLLVYLHRQSCRQHSSGSLTGGGSKGTQAGGASGAGSLLLRLARWVQLLEVQLLCLLTAAVGYGRIYLGYHTAGQVAAGLALGCAFAAAWWCLTLAVCRSEPAAALLRLAPLRALGLRNTLDRHDVHAEEAALCAAQPQSAAQKHAD